MSVFLVTGPCAAGKSTLARLLAQGFERAVYLEADQFRRAIVSGLEEMTFDASEEALRQLRLRYRIAAAAADAYAGEGFTVVLEDIVAGDLLHEFVRLVRTRPLHVVVLLPRVDVLAARDAARGTTGYEHFSVPQLHDLFARDTPRLGLWLDTSEQTPEQTVDAILRDTERTTP